MSDLNAQLSFLEENFNFYLEELINLAKIPSVSAPDFPPEKVEESAEYVVKLMKDCGLENVEILRVPDCHPYVYADWIHKPNAPTVLLYAHHDVQPPLREEIWKTKPFEPTVIDGRLYGRGTADDKAGVLIHVSSVAAYLKTIGELPLNVKVIIEGEEEIGSTHLAEFLDIYAEKLKSDVIVLTDLANFDTGIPSLTTSLRGLGVIELELSVLESPLHSGLWSGPIPDVNMAMSKVIADLTDSEGRINIPEIYEMVKSTPTDLLEDFDKLPLNEEIFKKQSKMLEGTGFIGGKDKHLLEKLWRMPSLVVSAVVSGGKKISGNVIMDSCWAKIGIRTVPNMDTGKTLEMLKKKIESSIPWGIKANFRLADGGNPWVTEVDHKAFSLAKKALTKGYDKEAVFIGCGASIPFVKPFSDAFGKVPALLVGVEDPYTNAHSENESLDLGDFKKSIRSQIYLFDELQKLNDK